MSLLFRGQLPFSNCPFPSRPALARGLDWIIFLRPSKTEIRPTSGSSPDLIFFSYSRRRPDLADRSADSGEHSRVVLRLVVFCKIIYRVRVRRLLNSKIVFGRQWNFTGIAGALLSQILEAVFYPLHVVGRTAKPWPAAPRPLNTYAIHPRLLFFYQSLGFFFLFDSIAFFTRGFPRRPERYFSPETSDNEIK